MLEDLVQQMSKVIIALDQSTKVSGYSIYKDGLLNDYGHISPSGDYLVRITKLIKWLENEILKNKNEEILILLEDIQLQATPDSGEKFNVLTFKKLAHCQGALLYYLVKNQINYEIVPSTVWKSRCKIKGTQREIQKKNAQKYVLDTFGIEATQDEADAICIGKSYLIETENDVSFDWSD